jgi:hypothetical protein
LELSFSMQSVSNQSRIRGSVRESLYRC